MFPRKLNINFGATNPVFDPVSPRNKMPFGAHERLLLKVSNVLARTRTKTIIHGCGHLKCFTLSFLFFLRKYTFGQSWPKLMAQLARNSLRTSNSTSNVDTLLYFFKCSQNCCRCNQHCLGEGVLLTKHNHSLRYVMEAGYRYLEGLSSLATP